MNKAEAQRVAVRLRKAEQKLDEALQLIKEASSLVPLREDSPDDMERLREILDHATVVKHTAVQPTRKLATKWGT